MLSGNLRNTVLHTKPNLKHILISSATNKCYFFRCNFIVRDLEVSQTLGYTRSTKDKMKIYLTNAAFFRILQNTFSSIPRTLKEQSSAVLRVWAHQCECVFAQRLRRCQQMFCLYTKLWEERALKDLLNRMRHQITRRGKELMLSAIGITAYNWDYNRISSDEIKRHMNELDYIHLLVQKTIGCESCNIKQIITGSCKCPAKQTKKQFEEWVPFVERKDMIVWRKLHNNSGNYEYKVYGSFDDVSGEDFLNVQIDIDYRKKWDTTAVSLELIEKDPTPLSNSDIVYWELLWPKLFANRDYVFNRRFMIDIKNKTIIIASRGTKHPACPIRQDKYRVDTYWSYMVIKPHTDFEKPGIEFGLTYFDDPGVNVPSTITTWVALRAMPDYLTRLRLATREYKIYCAQINSKCTHSLYKQQKKLEEEKEILSLNKQFETNKEKFNDEDSIIDTVKSSPNEVTKPIQKKIVGTITASPGSEIMTAPSPIIQAESSRPRYWKYLHPTLYFS